MQIKTQGLIIREQTVGESDRLVWALTRDEGMVRAFARRAKNLKDSKHAATGLLCYADLTLSRGRELVYINDARPIEVFFGLREDLTRLALAQYFCGLAVEAVPDGVEAGEILRLILNALHFLSTGEKAPAFLKPIVELRLLSLSGYLPDLVCCKNCGRYEHDRTYFKIGRGELYCGDCYVNTGEAAVALSRPALHAVRHIVYADFEKIFSFSVPPQAQEELSAAAEAYAVHTLQKRLPTLDFYASLL